MRRPRFALFRPAPLVGLTLLLVAGCRHVAPVEKAAAKVLISPQDEEQLGLQVQQQLAKQGVRYLNDPEVVRYVDSVANRVLAGAKRDRPDVTWHLHVIDDPKTVNAFSTPGGQLYVYTGLLLQVDNEAELAGVLAHEAGHEVARHVARHLVDTYGLQAVLGMALGNNPSLLQKVGAQLLATGTLLAHSRSEETEADEYGARYLAQAGYDPDAMVTFFQKLEKIEGHVPGVLKYISDHPLTRDRISHLRDYIASHHLTGSDLGADRIQPMQQALKAHYGAAGSSPR